MQVCTMASGNTERMASGSLEAIDDGQEDSSTPRFLIVHDAEPNLAPSFC